MVLTTRIKNNYVPILTQQAVMDHARAVGSTRMPELDIFVFTVLNKLRVMGFNPDVILGMSNLETDHWRSTPWADRLNPGGIGVTDSHDQLISFIDGGQAAMAFGVHFMAYSQGHNNQLAKYIALDSRFVKVHEAGFAGVCKYLDNFGSGKWATDPLYASKVYARIEEMRA